MMEEQKRIFLAVILSGAILFGWQYFFAPKFQDPSQMAVSEQSTPAVSTTTPSSEHAPAPAPSSAVAPSADSALTTGGAQAAGVENAVGEQQVTLQLPEKFKFSLNNKLELIDAWSYQEKFPFTEVVGSSKPFAIQLIRDNAVFPLTLNLQAAADGQSMQGINSELGVNFKAHITPDGKFSYQLTSEKPVRLRFLFSSSAGELPHRTPREFLLLSDDVSRVTVGKTDKGDVLTKWMGIDFNYHFLSLVFKDKIGLQYQMTENGLMVADMAQPVNQAEGYLLYVKKNYDDLTALGDNLNLAVDFGILGVVAVPILHVLQFLYNYIPNYGIAIILLTILMKIVTFPLQHKSYKSMKKMQVIQPELTKLRERFKDDPQRMQKESMELFKRAGANPLSGCLPLLLQMPIFFAFYKVLNGAVELVGAPFFAWIQDLSLKDPYYVMPVLMTAVMFIQQKLTPNTTTDPTQQKVMMFMPLIFGLIMKDLPSGLTLYILVSTVCGILQQLYVYKFVKA